MILQLNAYPYAHINIAAGATRYAATDADISAAGQGKKNGDR
jgi:hypothetical protein